MCGEKITDETIGVVIQGSPPRVRGKVCADVIVHIQPGITPACAGKRKRPRRWVRPPKDHPRVCGEKFALPVNAILKPGSPPRVRGKRVGAARIGCGVGITPAHAGKRLTLSVRSSIDLGSPPHVRGKVLDTVIEHAFDGITPAYAGKSCPPQAPTFTRQDHPRVCGEKLRVPLKAACAMGSPLRVRGKGRLD